MLDTRSAMLDGLEDEKRLRDLLKETTRLAASLARKKRLLPDGRKGQEVHHQTEGGARERKEGRQEEDEDGEEYTDKDYDLYNPLYHQSDSDDHNNGQEGNVREGKENDSNAFDRILFFGVEKKLAVIYQTIDQ